MNFRSKEQFFFFVSNQKDSKKKNKKRKMKKGLGSDNYAGVLPEMLEALPK